MNHKNHLTYNGTPVNTILEHYKNPPKPSEKNPLFPLFPQGFNFQNNDDKLLSSLHALFQKEIILSQHYSRKDYSFEDMLQTQFYLDRLDFLESIKYANNTVNPRKLLLHYLHSNYDYAACISLIKKATKKSTLKTTDNINKLIVPSQTGQPSPSASIRNHLNNFLEKQIKGYFKDKLYTNTTSSPKKIFYLPAYKIPEFLLFFSFFDGRNFENSFKQLNPDKLPTFSEKNSYSEAAYNTVLEKAKELYSLKDYDSSFFISTIHQCNKKFLFAKLNRLKHYYDLYQSDKILNSLISKFHLEKEDLKKALKKKHI